MNRERTHEQPQASANLPDEALVAEVLAGQMNRFEVLVRRYQAALLRFATGMVGDADDAADLVQESLVKAYTRLADCRNPSRFGAWLFRMLRNRCHDYLRNRRRRDVTLDAAPAAVLCDEAADPAVELQAGRLRHALTAALASLPPAQREAFLLKHVDGKSYEEMTDMLDVSVSALKMRVMRAREVLQVQLQTDVTPEPPEPSVLQERGALAR